MTDATYSSDEHREQLLDQLTQLDSSTRVLIRGATVLTLDPEIGDFDAGDVLIRGRHIEAVDADLSAAAGDGQAVIIDAKGLILIPGFVDAHRHCWQNQFRLLIPDADHATYMATTHGGFASEYRPEDMYAGDLVTLLGLLDGGVTSVLDFSHNTRSRAHSDAVFRAYTDSGIRAVHASCAPLAGEWERHWPEDLERLAEEAAARPLVTLRMGLAEARVRPIEELIRYARKLGIGITIDGVVGQRGAEIEALGEEGLLGPDVTVIHCAGISDACWDAIARSRVRVTLATTSDEQIGLADGVAGIQKALDRGIRPSLSGDVEICLAPDMFTQMRATLLTQRMHETLRRYRGEIEQTSLLSNRDVLEFATRHGAEAIGLGTVVGSLTAGKEADIVGIRGNDLNNLPLNNAVGTVVQGTDRKNIEFVLVGGAVRKWCGELVGQDVDAVRDLVYTSRDYLASRMGFDFTPTRPLVTKARYEHVTRIYERRGAHYAEPRP